MLLFCLLSLLVRLFLFFFFFSSLDVDEDGEELLQQIALSTGAFPAQWDPKLGIHVT